MATIPDPDAHTHRVRDALLQAAGVAAESPRDPLLRGQVESTWVEAGNVPSADSHLFRLREVLAVTEERLDAIHDHDAIRDAARELCRLVRWMDQHLTAGARPPMEWRDELTSPTPAEHELTVRAAFQAGVRRGIYDSVREGLNTWSADVPPTEDRYVTSALELGPPEWTEVSGAGGYPRRDTETTVSATIDAPLPWPSDDHTVPFDGGCEVAAAPGESWTPRGHETTFPCHVHVRVTYRDGTDAYYPVPDDQGWRIDPRTREVVIGKGLGRTHIPLDVVWSYSPEQCHPRRGRVQEHEAGPTARGES